MELKEGEWSSHEEKGWRLGGLPLESSPYVKYDDMEDYNNAYGTQGQLQLHPKPNQGGGGSTDANAPPSKPHYYALDTSRLTLIAFLTPYSYICAEITRHHIR